MYTSLKTMTFQRSSVDMTPFTPVKRFLAVPCNTKVCKGTLESRVTENPGCLHFPITPKCYTCWRLQPPVFQVWDLFWDAVLWHA